MDKVDFGLVEAHLSPMKQEDVDSVVGVHMKAFQGFFLTFLGPRFLRELYRSIVIDPSGIAYVYRVDRRVLGFVAGTSQPAGFYRRLLRQRWWHFGWAATGPILRRPEIIPRLLRAFRMPEQVDTLAGCGTLMSIAVLPSSQSKGVGKILVQAFLQEATRRRLNQVNLTTDKVNNNSVNSFYRKLGFRCSRSFTTPEGRAMNEYIIDLP
jgi:GNAT superfamily N-acetyltransferase